MTNTPVDDLLVPLLLRTPLRAEALTSSSLHMIRNLLLAHCRVEHKPKSLSHRMWSALAAGFSTQVVEESKNIFRFMCFCPLHFSA